MTKRNATLPSAELKEQTESNPNFISTIITDDDSEIYRYNLGTRQQSSKENKPNSPQPKKV
jgi:hypothetical protein